MHQTGMLQEVRGKSRIRMKHVDFMESRMTGVGILKIHNNEMSTSAVGRWITDLRTTPGHFEPISADIRGDFSFDGYAHGHFGSWVGGTSVRRGFTIEPAGDEFSLVVENGSCREISIGRTRHVLTAGMCLMTSADRYTGLEIHEGSLAEGFRVPHADIVKAIATTFDRSAPRNFEFMVTPHFENTASYHLRGLMRFFRESLCVEGEMSVSHLAMANFKEMFCLLMLENLPHSLSACNSSRVKVIAPRQIRRALEFARMNCGEPITIADMALASGVSVRALQVNFRRFLNLSPMEWLRRMRLEGVHDEIISGYAFEPVAKIARRWGFVHLGRFSAEYRNAFGEYPSVNLAKRRMEANDT